MNRIRSLIDLTRAHFFFAWPLLFCSGLFLAFESYGGFDWMLILKSAIIGLLGMEAGLVLNDYVDRDIDKRDREYTLTRYWRVFGTRPVSEGHISPGFALGIFFLLAGTSSALILTLPDPNRWYVLGIMLYCYSMEVFYQVKKRMQNVPVSQMLGRTDFALFPVAGYLAAGQPDMMVVYYFLFFYPFALAHLAVNDLIDIRNDRARELKTIPELYGIDGTIGWIIGFTLIHFATGFLFLLQMKPIAIFGFGIAFLLLCSGLARLQRDWSQPSAMKVLPLYHICMLIYSLTIIIQFAL